MNQSKNLSLHYLVLAGVISLGAVLRFWNLDLKPLWLDEVLTALLSLGHRYQDVPLEVVFSPATLHELFTLQPNLSCSDIAQAVATESTHPPLFFCLMHQWLNGVEPIAQPLSWKLRALPALFGVGAIASIYCLNRIAFSPTAGLMGAAFMAVSPFAVYLSQEARHYTLPVFLIILALLGLMHIQHTLHSRKQVPRPIVWLLWGVVNSFGCYVHYFFILAFIAQLLTLIGLMYWRRRMVSKSSWLAVTLVVMGVAMSYLPWLPIVLGDFGRPETDWLPKPQHLAPLYQTLIGWLSMIIALPVEGQPLWIQVISALLTIGFGIWVAQHSIRGFQQLWRQQETRIATLTLSGFLICVLLQFLAIIYLLGKDITIAPRYHFVYYPAICALLGASFASTRLKVRKLKVEGLNLSSNLQPSSLQPPNLQPPNLQPPNLQPPNLQPPNLQPPNLQPSTLQPATVFLCISLVSCIFVVSNLTFLKSFHPQQVAQQMNLEPNVPMMMVVGYQNFQDVALGLSFALAIDQLKRSDNQMAPPAFLFLHPEQFYESVWQKLSKLQTSPLPRLNLWVVAPGLRRREYPKQLTLANHTRCTIDPSEHYRIGIPYQLYRCVPAPQL